MILNFEKLGNPFLPSSDQCETFFDDINITGKVDFFCKTYGNIFMGPIFGHTDSQMQDSNATTCRSR
jgi:hypothetical protein